MIGKTFGFLIVMAECMERNKDRRIVYRCQCSCGNMAYVTGKALRTGTTVSCGHYQPIKKIKNAKSHNAYASYSAMKTRCYNKNHMHYDLYGGRGIKVCDRWLESFWNFIEDMGEKEIGLTLERINPNGDYCKDNCRWATRKEQAQNRNEDRVWELENGKHVFRKAAT